MAIVKVKDEEDKKEPCLSYWYNSDFAGCGQLRTFFPNQILNALYTGHNDRRYEGVVSSRLYVSEMLLPRIKVLHFQRQVSEDQIRFMASLKEARDNHEELSYQIIYDVDDLIGEVPLFNQASRIYNKPNIIENFKQVCSIADIITTTTYPLKKKIESFGGTAKVKIIPNYLPKYLYRPYEFDKPKNEKPKILWAGSATHFNMNDQGDFGLILDLILNTVDEFDWVLMGIKVIPNWLLEVKDKITLIPWEKNMYRFPTILKEVNADFGVAPLLDIPFNNCKSNIKLLDYFSCDTMAICSKVAPYKKESQLFFNEGHWKEDRDMIVDIFNDKAKKDKIIAKQRKILDKYWLEDNLKKYKDLLGF